MAISRITSQDNGGTGTNPTVTYPAATTTGDLLIIGVISGSSYATASGFTAINETVDAGGSFLTLLYSISTGSTSFSITSGSASQYVAYEYKGIPTINYLSTSNASTNGTTSSTTIVTGAITATDPNMLVFTIVGSSAVTLTVSSFTNATILPDTQSKITAGQYFPGKALSSYTDTATTTNKITSSITAAFYSQYTGFFGFMQ